MNDIESRDFESRVRESLTASVQHLDSTTKDRLYEIRRHALKASPKTRGGALAWLSTHYWASAGGLALCSLFVAMVMLPQLKSTHNEGAFVSDQTAMMELMENPEDADTLSDPGFYLWLDETQGAQSLEQQHAV